MALRLRNHVNVRREQRSKHSAVVRETAAKFFAIAKCRTFQFSCHIAGEVPVGRGLGSSATVRVGLLHGLNQLTGAPLTRDELFAAAVDLEGHPDNAAPATFGGFTVARGTAMQHFNVSPRLRCILLIPDFEVKTARARALLPKTIARSEAIMSAGNAAAIAAAFASRNYEALHHRFADGLHQPFRERLVPRLRKTIAAAEKAGALGAFLSGSGSTICALTLRGPERIGAAMHTAFRSPAAQIVITWADNAGASVTRAS